MATVVPDPATLNSGFKMPVLAFGSTTVEVVPADRLTEIFLDGVRAGYRHFDTAEFYGTEKALGDAMAEAIRQGLVGSREEFFVTSKLWCTSAHGDLVLPSLKGSLENLKLEYLDLYLIHWPVRLKKRDKCIAVKKPMEDEDQLPFDVKSTWTAMEECQRLGLAKSIGVSNFSCKKLSEVLSFCSIPPAVNQVEMNPLWDQRKLRGFCKEHGIEIIAYSPLGASEEWWGTKDVLRNPVLKEIAEAKGKSVAQICIRWLYEQGVSIAVKSFNGKRMRENLLIFDWALSEEDKKRMGEIPQRRGCTASFFVSPSGPYKTVEEFWDGEV